jgi:hypothetical protein
LTYLPFVASAYALGAALPMVLTIDALLRLRSASRRLDAIDPRSRK